LYVPPTVPLLQSIGQATQALVDGFKIYPALQILQNVVAGVVDPARSNGSQAKQLVAVQATHEPAEPAVNVLITNPVPQAPIAVKQVETVPQNLQFEEHAVQTPALRK